MSRSGVGARRTDLRWYAIGLAVLAALMAPLVLNGFLLQTGSLVFAAGIGAIGLMLLFGRVGQLSLAHPFFLAVGAYGYIWLASDHADGSWGLGVPTVLSVPLAMVLAALAGLAFSPISSRLKGLSLGLASLSLIFIGSHILITADPLTGGFSGRAVPVLSVGPVQLSGNEPTLYILGEQFGRDEKLWYVTLLLLIAVGLFTSSLLRSRIGRAFTAVRDAESHAAALGVEVARTRVAAFVLSGAYAGLAGALLAIIFQRVVPDYWGLGLSLAYLAMVVIGGLTSVGGAVLGAAFVTSLPILLQQYGRQIPGVGGAGLDPAIAAQFIYGSTVVLVLLFEPRGLIEPCRRFFSWLLPGRDRRAEASSLIPEAVDEPAGV